MIGVHVGELGVDEEADLVLAILLLLPNVSRDNSLSLLTKARVALHLKSRRKLEELEAARNASFLRVLLGTINEEANANLLVDRTRRRS